MKLTNTVLKLLILCFFFAGCSGTRTPKKEVRPTPKTEFSASLSGVKRHGLCPVDISTKRNRFRLTVDDLVFLGPLKTEGEILVLHPKSRRYLRVRKGRLSELFETHNRTAANRYERAVILSSAEHRRKDVQSAFLSPCQAAAPQPGQHQQCEMQPQGEDQQLWIHKGEFRRLSRHRGLTTTKTHSEIVFNTKHGVLVASENGFNRTMGGLEEKAFEDGHFELPEGYTEVLDDQELHDERFQGLGRGDMLKDLSLKGFKSGGTDFPGAPAPTEWIHQAENWWPHPAVSQRNPKFHLDRIFFFKPFDPDQLPINIDYKIKVEKWDDKAEFGERSFRESENSIVFFADNQLFRVRTPEGYSERLGELCQYLLE